MERKLGKHVCHHPNCRHDEMKSRRDDRLTDYTRSIDPARELKDIRLGDEVIESLRGCAEHLLTEDHIQEFKEEFIPGYKVKNNYEYALCVYMLLAFDMEDFTSRSCINELICYQEAEPSFKINGITFANRNAMILRGNCNGKKVVVKWSDCRDTVEEYDAYVRAEKAGCKVPWYRKYKLLDQDVLVLEELEPLDSKDNPYEVGVQILKILKNLHNGVGVHNDIKPDNIMKRRSNGSWEYLLIDYGGISLEKLGSNWKRRIWTPKWCSQRPHTKNQETSAKNDFIELVFTIKCLQIWSSMNETVDVETSDVQHGFRGKLLKCLDLIEGVSDSHERNRLIVDDLIKLLEG